MKIALYRGTSPISRLIRWQTRSRYSHAAFLCDDDSVIEAWHPRVRHVESLSSQHTPGTSVDIFGFKSPLTPPESDQLYSLAIQDVLTGIRYDYAAVLRFITRKPESLRSKAKLFCSEQIFSRCAMIGRILLDRTEAWRVPPDWISRSPLLNLETSIITQ